MDTADARHPPTHIQPPHRSLGRSERFATRAAFFVLGLGMAAWAPLIPFVKTRTGISESSIGLLLLCLGLGSIIAMPVAGALAHRYGCRLITLICGAMIIVSLPILAHSSSLTTIAVALFVFGAGIGAMDSTVNIQAVIVEKASDRHLMSGFHGMYSVGGIFGAGGPVIFMSAGASPTASAVVVSLCCTVLLVASARGLLPFGGSGSFRYALPKGPVLLVSLLCFVLFLAEGAVLDWSAIFLTSEKGFNLDHAGLGYASFATAMTVGRLTGDALVRRIGATRIVVVGSICAAVGMVVATVMSSPAVILSGYALVGLGCANIVPVLFSAIGRQTAIPQSVAIPTVTTIGYSGILLGPACIGLVAHASSLPVAFFICSGMLVAVGFAGRYVR